jgi:hypothetical protein
MSEPSERVQWAIIVVAYGFGIMLCVWLVSRGQWYFAAALVAASVAMGVNARRAGKPLYPGRHPRVNRRGRHKQPRRPRRLLAWCSAALILSCAPAMGQDGIDREGPTSQVSTIDGMWKPRSIPVQWSASDPSGVASYTVEVLEDGTWKPWLVDTTRTRADYRYTGAKLYRFRVVARDGAGNVGPPAESGTVTIDPHEPPPPPPAQLDRLTVGSGRAWRVATFLTGCAPTCVDSVSTPPVRAVLPARRDRAVRLGIAAPVRELAVYVPGRWRIEGRRHFRLPRRARSGQVMYVFVRYRGGGSTLFAARLRVVRATSPTP